MYRIGIDVGSTYTKYCVMDDEKIKLLSMEKSPVRQKEFFKEKINWVHEQYPGAEIVSCGYGKKNVNSVKSVNELTALAKGSHFLTKTDSLVLDIGGQDTKIILQRQGILQEFFINDKCAAGSGMFLSGVIDMLGKSFESIVLRAAEVPRVQLSSVCAVFAQSEIVELIAQNMEEDEILQAVVWQILVKSKPLLNKVGDGPLLISGGISQIEGIADFAEKALGRKCWAVEYGAYLAAIGCALS